MTDFNPPKSTATPQVSCAGPFIAAVKGTVPDAGRPILGGVELPVGRAALDGRVWLTDSPAPNPTVLWSQLASRFAETGLWPVLVGSSADFPPVPQATDDGSNGAPEAALLLERWWNEYVSLVTEASSGVGEDLLAPIGPIFPGLTPASPGCLFNALDVVTTDAASPTRLALVPAERPADVIQSLGWTGAVDKTPIEVATVLRSWEDRAGAVLYTISADSLELAIERPPVGQDRLPWAAELGAFNPDTVFVEDDLSYLTNGDPEPIVYFWWD